MTKLVICGKKSELGLCLPESSKPGTDLSLRIASVSLCTHEDVVYTLLLRCLHTQLHIAQTLHWGAVFKLYWQSTFNPGNLKGKNQTTNTKKINTRIMAQPLLYQALFHVHLIPISWQMPEDTNYVQFRFTVVLMAKNILLSKMFKCSFNINDPDSNYSYKHKRIQSSTCLHIRQ